MKISPTITTLFFDIGGVLLTDGWNTQSRKLAAEKFDLDFEEMEKRHRPNFETFELGKLSMREYLDRVVFYTPRNFSRAEFEQFMYDQSKPFPQMLDLANNLKERNGFRIAVISNESTELNEYRIKKFELNSFVDFYVSSCIVQLRKPDKDIYRLALGLEQVPPEQTLYIENTLLFVEVAESLGIKSIHHIDYESTCSKLSSMGILL